VVRHAGGGCKSKIQPLDTTSLMKKPSGNLAKLLKIVTYDLTPINMTIFHSYAQITEGKHM
jgi:hypothetical protein